jgi:multidrug transporter EmrE-like cation transporter
VSDRALGISCALVAVLLESVGHLLLKQSAERHCNGNNIFKLLRNACRDQGLLFGITCFLLEFVCWTFVLRFLDVSLAYQLGCLSFIGVALLSRMFLYEQITRRRWIGIVSILLGSIIVGAS